MVDRSDVDRITTASQEAVKSATNALEIFLKAAEGWPPEKIRDGLLELIPDLVNEYGDVAASAAADWYEQARSTEVAGSYRAVLAEPVPREQVEGTVRAAARHLFTGDVAVTQRILEGALHRYITSQTRNTTVRNTLRDPQAKRFARVPKGKTCSFCMIMASRGFVYATAKAAGELSRYHDKCDCQIVPAFGNTIPRIEGYDPDALLREYEAARNASAKEKANPTISDIAQKLRETGGDKYTDGLGVARPTTRPRPKKIKNRKVSLDGSLQQAKVDQYRAHAVASLARLGLTEDEAHRLPPSRYIDAPGGWPEDLPALRANTWYHTLYGDARSGGHLYGYGWRFGTDEFPPGWTAQDVLDAAVQVLRQQGIKETQSATVTDTVDGIRVRVAYRNDAKSRRIKSIHRYTRDE